MDSKDEEKVRGILAGINDPEIGISIAKLGMIGDIKEESGLVVVEIKLTVPGCPLIKTLESQIISALSSAGYKPQVNFTYMSKQELDRAKEMIASERRELPFTIQRYTRTDEKKDIKKVIAVYSAKGGVGKSTVVVSLALAAKSLGLKVGILDCDVSGPSIKSILGIEGYATAMDDRRIQPYVYDGLEVVSLDLLSDAEAVVWRGPLVSGAIKQMYDDTVWGRLDLLLLDLPPGTSDAPITVFQSIPTDGLVVVTTPQDLSVITGKKTLFMAKELGIPVIGAIENMSYVVCPHCGEKIPIGKQGREHGVDILARLPFSNEQNPKAVSEKIAPQLENVMKKLIG